MRSPGDRRAWGEAVARAVALLCVLGLGWRAGGRPARAVAVTARGLAVALPGATRVAVPTVHLRADSLPGARERAWLRALRDAGTPVTWSRGPLAPPFAALDMLPGPERRVRLSMLGVPPGAELHDAVGRLAAAPPAGTRVQEVDLTPAGTLELRSPAARVSRTSVPDTSLPRVLVLARAGWEGRFVALALQEAGWAVESDFLVNSAAAGEAASVRTRGGGALDGTLSAVVALDQAAAPRAPAIAAWVRAGGGLLLGPDAMAVPALAALSPARLAPPQPGSLGALSSASPRRGLDRHALRLVDSLAVPVEREGAVVRLAARRLELGRVGLLGYRETWRWRMEGDADAPEAHATWWSGVVAAVARPGIAPAAPVTDDPAPWPSMVDALGPPAPVAPLASARDVIPVDALLLSLATLALLLAWSLRRSRGLP